MRKLRRMDWRFLQRSRGEGVSSKGFATSKFFFACSGTSPENLAALEDAYKTRLTPTGQ